MQSDEWVPEDVDTERPSPARMYDYLLGGAHNFEVDRRAAEQAIAADPDVTRAAWVNRAFLRRAVEFLVDAGVRQFLDIGSGIPTVGHVHEIAQGAAPESRVMFVDVDPVAVAHSSMMLAGNDRAAVIQEDVRRPERILDAPEARRLLDFDQPVAVLAVGLFHFISDADDPARILSRLTARLVSGSYLALSHGTEDGPRRAAMVKAKEIFSSRAGVELTWRSHAEVEALFDGFDLIEPGLVWTPSWRPESPDDLYHDQPEESGYYAGVGCKR
jgi:hypothetical protein